MSGKAPMDDAPHLLVVDDDRVIRQTLARYLATNGYRVTTAEHAKAARAKINGLAFDTLILDVMMPGETGLELARAVRQGETLAQQGVPIIMLTARSEAEDRIKGWKSARMTISASLSSRVNCCYASPPCCGVPCRNRHRLSNPSGSEISASISTGWN